MDKQVFLEELRKSLRVLKDEEIDDIVGEYEQHIDLKVENGQTVEQAIADFGHVKELAAEILEGYHVKAEFDLPKEEIKSKRAFLVSGKTQFKGFVRTIIAWIRAAWNLIIHCFLWCGKQIVRPFVWMKIKMQSNRTSEETIEPKEHPNHFKNWIKHKMKGLGIIMLKLWDWLVRKIICCLCLGWNCCIISIALFTGGFGLMCLFAFGVLGVLLFQGYPIIGLTIGCLGLVVCLFAATAFIWTLIWHIKQANENMERKVESVMVEVTEMEEGQHA